MASNFPTAYVRVVSQTYVLQHIFIFQDYISWDQLRHLYRISALADVWLTYKMGHTGIPEWLIKEKYRRDCWRQTGKKWSCQNVVPLLTSSKKYCRKGETRRQYERYFSEYILVISHEPHRKVTESLTIAVLTRSRRKSGSSIIQHSCVHLFISDVTCVIALSTCLNL